MKKNILNIGVGVALCGMMTLMSCSESQPTDYTGTDYVYLSTQGYTEMHIHENNELQVKVTTVMRASEDMVLHPQIKSLNGGDVGFISIKEKEVVLKKGERYATFTLVAKKDANISQTYYYDVVLPADEQQLVLAKPLRFSITSDGEVKLTEKQQELLDLYKRRGMDISPFIGYVQVSAKVHIPADGGINGFENEETKTYTGKSVITLSEQSTPDNIVLKMVGNPMGINEFFYFAMKANTIDNTEFWYGEDAGPAYAKVMDLIQWNKKSLETFSSELDGISFPLSENGKSSITYDKKVMKDDEEITLVPFVFNYTAWDRLKKLIDAGNEEAIECNDQGATSNPNVFLNNSDISKNTFDDDQPFPPSSGSIDCRSGIMKFHFLTSVENAGGYITVDVEYKGNVKLE